MRRDVAHFEFPTLFGEGGLHGDVVPMLFRLGLLALYPMRRGLRA